MYTITGTGSRSLAKDPLQFNKIQTVLAGLIEEAKLYYPGEGELRIMAGGAEGFDHALARAAYKCGVPYVLALPNKGYGQHYWGKASQCGVDRMDIFNAMVDNAAEVIYVCPSIYAEDGRHSNFIRNEYMINNSDEVWVYNPTTPGTKQAYSYTRSCNKYHRLIQPDWSAIEWTTK